MLNISFKPLGGVSDKQGFVFVVPKSVSNKATTRNLLKRRARHIIKTHKNEIKKETGGFFFFKKGAEGLTFKKLENEIVDLLKKNKII